MLKQRFNEILSRDEMRKIVGGNSNDNTHCITVCCTDDGCQFGITFSSEEYGKCTTAPCTVDVEYNEDPCPGLNGISALCVTD